jgi:hypothetical protein
VIPSVAAEHAADVEKDVSDGQRAGAGG